MAIAVYSRLSATRRAYKESLEDLDSEYGKIKILICARPSHPSHAENFYFGGFRL